MNDLPENELLSAYLDGELSAAEQAAVEQLLARDPAARQRMDELRALSATLKSIPTYRLPEDFSREVLRLAQQRSLAETDQPHQETAVGDGWRAAADVEGVGTGLPESAPSTDFRSILRRAIRPRNLLWPAIAVAAAIMIMVTNSDRLPRGGRDRDVGPVAMAPKGAAIFEEPSIGPAVGAEGEAVRRHDENLLREEALRNEPGTMGRMSRRDLTAGAKVAAMKDGEMPSAAASPEPRVGGGAFSASKVVNDFANAKKSEEPLVVLCKVTPAALRSGALERTVNLGQAAEPLPGKGFSMQPMAAKAGEERVKAGDERVLDVELTEPELHAVLVSLRSEPQFFPLVLENPTAADLAPVQSEPFGGAASPNALGGARAASRVSPAVTPRLEAKPGQQMIGDDPDARTAEYGALPIGSPPSRSVQRAAPAAGPSAPTQAQQPSVDAQIDRRRAESIPSVPQASSRATFQVAPGRPAEPDSLRQSRSMQAPAAQIGPRLQTPVQQQEQAQAKRRVRFLVQVVSDVASSGASSKAAEPIAKKHRADQQEQSKPATAPAKPATKGGG